MDMVIKETIVLDDMSLIRHKQERDIPLKLARIITIPKKISIIMEVHHPTSHQNHTTDLIQLQLVRMPVLRRQTIMEKMEHVH
jgi:hypothetical protein